MTCLHGATNPRRQLDILVWMSWHDSSRPIGFTSLPYTARIGRTGSASSVRG
jgi:hypothetical protein